MAETAQNIEVLICTGTGGIASGSLKVADAFEAEFVKHGLEATKVQDGSQMRLP